MTVVQKQAKAVPVETQEHQKVVAQIQYRTKVLTRKVVEHVKDNRACDLPPDAVRLLNAANH